MADISAIEWTDSTWNPVRGCSRISEGCRHCYAEVLAARFSGSGRAFDGLVRRTSHGPRWTGIVRVVEKHLDRPLKWARPRKIFVNSMSDLFHESLATEHIAAIARVMVAAKWHTFQVLTKRTSRMAALLRGELQFAAEQQHILWGTSVENKTALSRIDDLRSAPAAARFLSVEPLLEDLGTINLNGIHWVIVGGESGPGARPMQAEWVRSLRDQCGAANVPFFFKQWGGVRKKRHGRLLEGREYNEYPVIRSCAVPSNAERRVLVNEFAMERRKRQLVPLRTLAVSA